MNFRSELRRWSKLPADAARSHAEEALQEAGETLGSDPARAARCARLAAAAADVSEDNPTAALAWAKLAEARMRRRQHSAALRAYDKAHVLAVSGASEARVARIEIQRLRPLLALGRYVELRSSAQRCLDRCERLDDPLGLIQVHLTLGDLEMRFARAPQAMRHYDEVAALMPPNATDRAREMLAARRRRACAAAEPGRDLPSRP